MRQLPVEQRPVAGDPIEANIILFKICLPAEVRPACQRMVMPTGGDIAVVGQRGEFDAGRQVLAKQSPKSACPLLTASITFPTLLSISRIRTWG